MAITRTATRSALAATAVANPGVAYSTDDLVSDAPVPHAAKPTTSERMEAVPAGKLLVTRATWLEGGGQLLGYFDVIVGGLGKVRGVQFWVRRDGGYFCAERAGLGKDGKYYNFYDLTDDVKARLAHHLAGKIPA